MKPRLLIPCVFAVLLGACNFNVLVVEVESSEVCVTGLSAEIPADAEGSVSVTLSRDEAQPDAEGPAFEIDVPDGWEVTEVTLLGVGIRAKDGIDNLHFLRSLHLEMSGSHPEMELPTLKLIDIEIDELPYNTSDRTTTFLEATAPFNLVDYLDADELEFGLSMTGDMPTTDWEIGMEVCFTFTAEYRENL